MSRRKYVLDRILKQDRIIHPSPNDLWCKRCQRGITNHEEWEHLKSGDDCPICEMLAIDGDIAYEARGVLITCQESNDEWLEKVKMKHKMDKMKEIRSIKNPGDEALEKLKEQDKVLKELREQLAAITGKNEIKEEVKENKKTDAVGIESSKGTPTVGKIDTKGSK